jgi:hypothetical protein
MVAESLTERISVIHQRLSAAQIDYAFGGALALAWCTEQARGTIDIDINIFLSPETVRRVRTILGPEVVWANEDEAIVERDGQVRVWWLKTPIDLFFNTTPFHEAALTRVRFHSFLGESIPFLGCGDLAVFKAFFNRTKDWADLEAMVAAQTLDVDRVIGVLVQYLGSSDERVARLLRLVAPG